MSARPGVAEGSLAFLPSNLDQGMLMTLQSFGQIIGSGSPARQEVGSREFRQGFAAWPRSPYPAVRCQVKVEVQAEMPRYQRRPAF